MPVLAVALNIDFLTTCLNIIVLLSKVMQRGRDVAHTLSCCDAMCFQLCVRLLCNKVPDYS